jgi:hypothetical protein
MSAWQTRLTRLYAQGARCGHLEGKGRAGSYVTGEEHNLAWDASHAQGFSDVHETEAWARGYYCGYRLAASGEELPENLEREELP